MSTNEIIWKGKKEAAVAETGDHSSAKAGVIGWGSGFKDVRTEGTGKWSQNQDGE